MVSSVNTNINAIGAIQTLTRRVSRSAMSTAANPASLIRINTDVRDPFNRQRQSIAL